MTSNCFEGQLSLLHGKERWWNSKDDVRTDFAEFCDIEKLLYLAVVTQAEVGQTEVTGPLRDVRGTESATSFYCNPRCPGTKRKYSCRMQGGAIERNVRTILEYEGAEVWCIQKANWSE